MRGDECVDPCLKLYLKDKSGRGWNGRWKKEDRSRCEELYALLVLGNHSYLALLDRLTTEDWVRLIETTRRIRSARESMEGGLVSIFPYVLASNAT